MTLSFGGKEEVCGDAVCRRVRWRAMVPLPEPEKAVTMLYGGISDAIGGVGGVDTDVNNVIGRRQSRWRGCCKAGFGEGTQLKILSLK